MLMMQVENCLLQAEFFSVRQSLNLAWIQPRMILYRSRESLLGFIAEFNSNNNDGFTSLN